MQDLILQNRDEIYNLVFQDNGYIMICGDISKLFEECLNNLAETLLFYRKDLSYINAREILKGFVSQGKILTEKWN